MDPNHIYEELRKIDDKLGHLSITLAKNSVVLEDHKMRSDRSEKRLELLEIDANRFRGFFLIGGWLLAIIAGVTTLLMKVKGL